MEVKLEKKDANLATIKVETEAGRAKDEYKKVARRLGQHINIPGFRKGKAPIKMIEAQVGESNIKAETLNMYFLSELLYEAFNKEKLDVVFIPSIDKVEFDDPQAPVKIEATIELFPEVELGDYKSIDVKVDVPKFEEKEYVKDTLDKIAGQFATYEETDTAIEMKDEVVFDFAGTVLETKESLPELKADNYQIIIEPGRFVGDFLEQMVGLKVGDEKDVTVTFPEDYAFDKVKGKEVCFKVKVHKISRAKLPEMDDELAKKVGSDTLEDLKKRIVDEMNKINDNNQKSIAGEEVVKQLIEKSKFEITDAMIDRELDSSLDKVKKQYGMNDEQFEEFKKNQDLAKEKEAAKERVERSIVITAVIKKEDIKAEEAEVTEKMNEILMQLGPQANNIDLNQFSNNISMEVTTNKVVEFLIDNAKVNYNFITEEEAKKKDKEKAAK